MVLIAFVEFDEIAAPTPHSNYQVWIFFGVYFGVEQLVPVDCVELELMAAELYECPHEHCELFYGFIVPDVSGDYVFYVAGDDSATLFLSTDETPAKAKAIARTSAWTNPKQFTKSPSQKSAPVKLEKGKKYYVEAVMFEGAGGDNLSFAWVVPGKNAPEIISEKNLKTMK